MSVIEGESMLGMVYTGEIEGLPQIDMESDAVQMMLRVNPEDAKGLGVVVSYLVLADRGAANRSGAPLPDYVTNDVLAARYYELHQAYNSTPETGTI